MLDEFDEVLFQVVELLARNVEDHVDMVEFDHDVRVDLLVFRISHKPLPYTYRMNLCSVLRNTRKPTKKVTMAMPRQMPFSSRPGAVPHMTMSRKYVM